MRLYSYFTDFLLYLLILVTVIFITIVSTFTLVHSMGGFSLPLNALKISDMPQSSYHLSFLVVHLTS